MILIDRLDFKMNFTREEYADMHLLYGRAFCSATRARNLYAQQFPNRNSPSKNTFVCLDRRLRETGKSDILLDKNY